MRCSTAVATMLALALPSAAQTVVSDAVELERVDQSIEDADALSTSLRELRTDLRQPVGFEDVFRISGNEDVLIRVGGGMFAVFPRSVYVNARFGPIALIPGGTVFYMGRESLEMAGLLEPMSGPAPYLPYTDPAGQRLNNISPPATARLETRLELPPVDLAAAEDIAPSRSESHRSLLARPEPAFEAQPFSDHTVRIGPQAQWNDAVTIATDASYRSRRLGDLIRRAAHAARGPSSSSSK
jgi:hypothetical protein